MAEFQMTERDIKTLQATVQIGEPARPTDIGEITGDSPLIVGRTLKHLAKGDLAEQTDKKIIYGHSPRRGKPT
jgi:hypothetical protein